MSMSGFSSYTVSPLADAMLTSSAGVKTEMDYGFSPSRHHVCNQALGQSFHSNPHSRSSCMYKTSVSPCSLLPAKAQDHCLAVVSVKENSALRGIPACRRRLDFNHNAFADVTKVGPVTVAKRNERERNRVKLINMTFQTLRQHLPLGGTGVKGKSRKLSKVQTLRSAIDYIRQLQDLVHSRQQQHQQIEYHSKIEDKTSSLPACRGDIDMKHSRQSKTIDIRSPNQRDGNKGYLLYQTVCDSVDASLAVEESAHKLVSASGLHADNINSSSTTTSNAESPFSDASSYEAVGTTDDDEYIDFDEWF